MPLLDPQIRQQIKALLDPLTSAVTLHIFTQEFECQFCRENRQLAEELSEVVPEKVKVEVHNFLLDKNAVDLYQINKIPGLAVVGKEDYGIRFYGIPAGYEFTSLINAIKIVSNGQSGLSQASRDKLGALTKPVHLKVYVTPTCPYCPAVVQLSHQLAIASPRITAEMIAASEFPQLAIRDQVMGVPKTVIDGVGAFEGALPEPLFVNKIIDLVTGSSR